MKRRPKEAHCSSFLLTLVFFNTLVITSNILDYILPVPRNPQTKDSVIAQSTDMVKSQKLSYAKIKK